MVSKIQKRGSYLATTIDPKVLRELLTHDHGGTKADEEASNDGFPLRQAAGTGLQIEYPRNMNLRQWKRVFADASGGFVIYVNI